MTQAEHTSPPHANIDTLLAALKGWLSVQAEAHGQGSATLSGRAFSNDLDAAMEQRRWPPNGVPKGHRSGPSLTSEVGSMLFCEELGYHS